MRRFTNRLLVTMLAPTLLLVGCDDDASTPDVTAENQINQGLAGLAAFGASAAADPGAQLLLGNADISALAAAFGLDPTAGGTLKMPTTAREIRAYRSVFTPTAGKRAVDFMFGTYMYDAEDATEPFPGWVLIAENEPADGLVFQWGVEDGFMILDANNMPVAVGGQLGFRNIVADDGGTPEDPNDDVITSMLFQLEIDPGTGLDLVAQISFMVILDPETREPTSIWIGDEENTADSFVGPISFAFHLTASETNLTLVLQLVDTSTSPNYSVRLDALVAGYDPETETAESVSATFSYGTTTDPTMPPWAITLTLSDFDPETMVAQVSGGITFQDVQLATFSGDTTEVAYEGGTCINVDVTFADTGGEPAGNVCEVFPEFFSSVEGSIGGFGSPVNVWR